MKNPDVVVDGRNGDIYPKLPNGSLGDPIGNIHDEVDTRHPKHGRKRSTDRQWITIQQVQDAIKVGAGAGGAALIIWWVGKLASPACGIAFLICVDIF